MLPPSPVNVRRATSNGQIYYITDLNRRPVDKDSMKKRHAARSQENGRLGQCQADSVQALAR